MGFFDWLKRTLNPFEDPDRRNDRRNDPRPPPARPPAPPGPRLQRTLNLDARTFSPLGDAEVRKAASRLGQLWGNPWFGRRDLIPPVADERTLLIDRAMVAHGLITPERLAEIHRIGEEMDRIRPHLALARQIAEEAVKQAEADRAERKRRKKEEAAERERKRKDAVERRRAEDIVFLGRGVSRGLADRRAHVEKLQQAGLPVLATPADVARALEISIPRLRWLAFHNESSTVSHYVRFTVPKKSGGTRELASPHRSLAKAQQWVRRNILEKLPLHDAAHGFVRGRGTRTNAAPHVGKAVVVNCDLKDFFPTITFPRVEGLFRGLGYSPAAATVLALLCTDCPRKAVQYDGREWHVAAGPRALPQGACTSPALSNRAARRLDARLAGIARKLEWTYTRYADDLTFSADPPAAGKIGYLLARVRHIAADEGFQVNEAKTRVLRRAAAQSVTGIVVNTRPGVPRRMARALRAMLHRAGKQGLAAASPPGDAQFLARVRGRVAYVSMVNPQQGEPLRRALAAVLERKGP